MEFIVQGLLYSLGAPVALVTPTVGAVIMGGYAFKAFEEAKNLANGRGGRISEEIYFWISIFLAIGALSFVWATIKIFAEIIGSAIF